MKKRNIGTIKMYDYATEADFLKDKAVMEEKGYKLITEESYSFGSIFKHGQIDTEDYKYTACYVKDTLC